MAKNYFDESLKAQKSAAAAAQDSAASQREVARQQRAAVVVQEELAAQQAALIGVQTALAAETAQAARAAAAAQELQARIEADRRADEMQRQANYDNAGTVLVESALALRAIQRSGQAGGDPERAWLETLQTDLRSAWIDSKRLDPGQRRDLVEFRDQLSIAREGIESALGTRLAVVRKWIEVAKEELRLDTRARAALTLLSSGRGRRGFAHVSVPSDREAAREQLFHVEQLGLAVRAALPPAPAPSAQSRYNEALAAGSASLVAEYATALQAFDYLENPTRSLHANIGRSMPPKVSRYLACGLLFFSFVYPMLWLASIPVTLVAALGFVEDRRETKAAVEACGYWRAMDLKLRACDEEQSALDLVVSALEERARHERGDGAVLAELRAHSPEKAALVSRIASMAASVGTPS
jgi:hypothetical protein